MQNIDIELRMSQVLVHFGEATLKAIDRISPAARGKRADFLRQAVKDEIFRIETERMREAYRLEPVSAEDTSTWDLPKEWKEWSSSKSGGGASAFEVIADRPAPPSSVALWGHGPSQGDRQDNHVAVIGQRDTAHLLRYIQIEGITV